jgi:hypothetical protein
MTAHRHAAPGEHEHEFEAAPGLPEPLPPGERILWQGRPDWRRVALRAFHARKLAIYFAAILVLRGANVLADGHGISAALVAMAWLLPLVVFALGTVLTLAWLTGRTTVYTITSKRVVMRIGIVLTLTFNLPLKRIASAGLRVERDGLGDIPLTLAEGSQIAWLHLWPHCRPWQMRRPEPMLRSLQNAEQVAAILARAWSQATGVALPSSHAVAEATVARPAADRGALTLA